MELGDYLKDPVYAAIFAALAVAGYLHLKNKMNNEPDMKPSEYETRCTYCTSGVVYCCVRQWCTRNNIKRTFLNLKIK